MPNTKELTLTSPTKRNPFYDSNETMISLASVSEGSISINNKIRVLSRLSTRPYSTKSRTDFFLITWNPGFENDTRIDREVRIAKDISVPIQNAVVVCEIKSDMITESKTNTEMSRGEADKLNFFGKIISLQNVNKIDTALRVMFKDIDQYVLKNEINFCNELFIDPRAFQFNKDLQIGFLSITLPWKSKLPNRLSYIDFVKSTLFNFYSKEKTEKLLSGLI